MEDKAAGPESSGDKASPGNKPGSPDRATAGQAKSRDSARQQNKAASADEVQPEFREALERKRANDADANATRGGQDAGKIHGARGLARSRRSFRRKTGG